MPDVRIPSSSRIYYRQQVKTATDPMALPVSMAAKVYDLEPDAADFKTATWVTEGGLWYAQVLVGEDGQGLGVLPEGIYKTWVKVTATPEVPVLESRNFLVIT